MHGNGNHADDSRAIDVSPNGMYFGNDRR